MKNRKDRRTEAAKARKTERKNGASAATKKPVQERLQEEIHEAIARVVPHDTSRDDMPFPEIIQGLGLVAAAFGVQSGVTRADFVEAMGGYYDGIAEALGIATEPKGPTLVLP
jgi:hypothetical protein